MWKYEEQSLLSKEEFIRLEVFKAIAQTYGPEFNGMVDDDTEHIINFMNKITAEIIKK